MMAEVQHRKRGVRLSLTAFEADWLWLILDTCGEIAMDTLPYVGPMPDRVSQDPDAAWDRILEKLARVTP